MATQVLETGMFSRLRTLSYFTLVDCGHTGFYDKFAKNSHVVFAIYATGWDLFRRRYAHGEKRSPM